MKDEFALLGNDLFGEAIEQEGRGELQKKFTIPPFSILNAREGLWQERKRAWLALGIQSEVGRDTQLIPNSGDMGSKKRYATSPGGSPRPACDYKNRERGDGAGRAIKGTAVNKFSRQEADKRSNLNNAPLKPEWATSTGTTNMAPGTSIFDPVLCELAYTWFCPPGGQIIDPFAGGSVRGIVAHKLGYKYWGCDLRQEQIEANEKQANDICGEFTATPKEEGVDVVISEKCARWEFQGCSEDYIRGTCNGRCCWTTDEKGKTYTLIHVEEDQKEAIKKQGGCFRDDDIIQTGEDGKCVFQDKISGLCDLHCQQKEDGESLKPRSCFISPWILSKNNRLIIRNRYKLLRCFKTEPKIQAYIAFASGLKMLFGDNEYDKIYAHFNNGGGDYAAKIPSARANLVKDVMSIWHDGQYGTPIERVGDAWVKRDDYAADGLGAKGRAINKIIDDNPGIDVLVTGGSRHSVQIIVAARICQKRKIRCRIHVPSGADTQEVKEAEAVGAEIIRHKPGYSSVIATRSKTDAEDLSAIFIPLGLECDDAIELVAKQSRLIPNHITRVVVCGGSGITAAGILKGTEGRNIRVVVAEVGANTMSRISKYAAGNEDRVEIKPAISPYDKPARATEWRGIQLDPYYEAKAVSYIEPGDLFWISANRTPQNHKGEKTELLPFDVTDRKTNSDNLQWICGDAMDELPLLPDESADFIFTCPPYGNLEVYSDDPRDLSNMEHHTFIANYKRIILRACKKLKNNRFAAIVVGDFRDKKGNYRNFVSDTIAAFREQGLHLYNEVILITAIGSLPIRITKQFEASRKIGKTHQNLLVFVKGDGKEATCRIV